MMKRLAILTFFAAAALGAEPGGGKYVGVASCVNAGCHGSTQPLDSSRVLQNEYYTWLNHDKHAQAYNVLFNERSARIVRNMRLLKKAYEEKVCLDCHSTNVAAQDVSGQIDKEDGVQCEACHGPASGWRDTHMDEGWTHEQSVRAGMIDLDHLATRAHRCNTCHLGNAQKEVDHELIASGHPVLAFELDNYAASMPPHWKRDDAKDGVRAWAVGQAMKFRDSLGNLARHARGEEWPEFSDMNCTNCHHSLKGSTPRQERGWPDRAGLPSWSPQHWAVMRIVIGRVSPQTRDQLDPLVAQLARGVARMNDPAGVAATADRARGLVHEIVPRIDGARWNDADIRALMSAIAGDAAFIERADVFAAEQAALSLQSLAAALTRRDPKLLRGAMTKSIDALFEELQNRDDYDPARFAAKLGAVKNAL
jgi:Cytochrome c554 and c-prime